MATHISKEQLGLMLPGTMNHYFQDRPALLEDLYPGLFARLSAAVAAWFAPRTAVRELAGMTDAQLADIGIRRDAAPLAVDSVRRAHERTIIALQIGRPVGF